MPISTLAGLPSRVLLAHLTPGTVSAKRRMNREPIRSSKAATNNRIWHISGRAGWCAWITEARVSFSRQPTA